MIMVYSLVFHQVGFCPPLSPPCWSHQPCKYVCIEFILKCHLFSMHVRGVNAHDAKVPYLHGWEREKKRPFHKVLNLPCSWSITEINKELLIRVLNKLQCCTNHSFLPKWTQLLHWLQCEHYHSTIAWRLLVLWCSWVSLRRTSQSYSSPSRMYGQTK